METEGRDGYRQRHCLSLYCLRQFRKGNYLRLSPLSRIVFFLFLRRLSQKVTRKRRADIHLLSFSIYALFFSPDVFFPLPVSISQPGGKTTSFASFLRVTPPLRTKPRLRLRLPSPYEILSFFFSSSGHAQRKEREIPRNNKQFNVFSVFLRKQSQLKIIYSIGNLVKPSNIPLITAFFNGKKRVKNTWDARVHDDILKIKTKQNKKKQKKKFYVGLLVNHTEYEKSGEKLKPNRCIHTRMRIYASLQLR